MRLSILTELTWRLYQNGKAFANNQNLLQTDIQQKVKTSFADLIRQRFYESRKLDDFGSPDYSFISPLLITKRFEIQKKDREGYFRCDMSEFDMYRVPGNGHITNVYPYSEEGCVGPDSVITQVNPGEENFYRKDQDLSEFVFFVIKGKGLNVYNLPECITHLDVEATFDDDDPDVDMAAANVVIDQILNLSLGIRKQYYSEDAKRQIDDQNLVK